ncbi:hypothetical protein HUZ36_00190 [Pseudoalteromonas sp. McH1-7]|uniref:Uncharacterized protein n=1 Tax=Pseudoalteromonas peptidolytica F12-50-A1 TaxID=1315280 RepID=A0A8I0MWL7_9GAMM|nr:MULTISPECIES: hypothetical protein [Pseudoalteromonas]MBE0346469.1 hypothetical protein [Pseudoalteromonas peptidolytica F12-50-A1]MDW7550605.1 hypothetical protein [Pseudoalteromonas peptidolytica]NLR14591.1 hypothetical protein [Pseudoalteromonas peptidolytica]NUZ09187.1 hypothetical protein [Pseudoalteromonas sp. McH1-7]GEK11284.1 hypothetical protein PPE03_35330 [Pseudoalteromonas peptidolytica]
MTWFKSKEQGKVYEVTAVIKAADKRLVNPLICHQCHMLVSYQGAGGDTKSEKLLYDDTFYKAFQNRDSCYVMVDDNGIRHYHPSEK